MTFIQSLVPSTLFNWFVEWTRKHFKEFLKTAIHSLYVDSRNPIHLLHKLSKENQEKTTKDNVNVADPFLIINRKSLVRERPQIETQKDKKESK